MPRKKRKSTPKSKRPFIKLYSRYKNRIPQLLIGCGIFLLIFAGIREVNTYRTLRMTQQQQAAIARLQAKVESSTPVVLEFPHLNFSVNVESTTLSSGNWHIPRQAVAHLSESAYPGFAGNIILYGHNRWDVLGKLSQVELTDQINVQLKDGSSREYQIIQKNVVAPDAIEYLTPTSVEVLTIYTCTGWFDSQRLVVRARPIQ